MDPWIAIHGLGACFISFSGIDKTSDSYGAAMVNKRNPGWRKLARLSVITATILVWWVQTAVAGDPAGQLDALLRSLPTSKAVCGAAVADADTGEVLFTHHADTPLIPASNAKLFVMAAALDILGADFEFRTSLMVSGDDLLVVGSGDPGFGDPRLSAARDESVTAIFDRWAAALLADDRRTIAGDLILDESIFDAEYVHPDWDSGDLQKWYAAPVGALNLNDNCLDITVRPAARSGAPVMWEVNPPTTLVEIDNRCKTGGAGHPVIHKPGRDLRYTISGGCHKSWAFPPVAVSDPGAIFGDVLRTVLKKHGVVVKGAIRRIHNATELALARGPGTLIAEHRTPLADVLNRIGKDSQNLFAECLLKRLGHEWQRRQGSPEATGTWAGGRAAIRAWLDNLTERPTDGVADRWAGMIIADGSGLSRTNRMTARQIVDLLTVMHTRPDGDIFAESLSVAGRDGSLHRHKRLGDLTGAVRAKTGTLTGVKALSGYVDTPSGRRLAFSVVFNGITGPGAPFNELHDRVCRILADWPDP
ncbi:MAG: D-alanyl-D-alanine carboxypeptidase/D-alanyl-D-alanine-endopeptidase [Planctomycetes bacterium]|nr:D-alanyl-D-alanine carboxypeptidase/D-alanyl-D-alanine-endopeptidase [Planctomycetota bacterium]